MNGRGSEVSGFKDKELKVVEGEKVGGDNGEVCVEGYRGKVYGSYGSLVAGDASE